MDDGAEKIELEVKQARQIINKKMAPMAWAVALGALLFLGAVAPAAAILPDVDGGTGQDWEDSIDIEQGVEDESDQFEGLMIRGYDFSCDLELCQSSQRLADFRQISGLAVGQRYDAERIERAQRRLATTGFFRGLQVERRLEGDGVHISIQAQGAVLIHRVRFEGLQAPPFESELRKVLMFRPGQHAPLDESDASRVTAQISSLAALFEREGYFGTEIRPEIETVRGEPHLVDLIFYIERGQDRRICSLGFRGVRAMTVPEARELVLSGVSVMARRVPLFLPMFTTEQFRNGREALMQAYREQGYFRARIVAHDFSISDTSNCVALLIDVNEGPFWDIEFVGNNQLTEEELRVHMPFGESGYVDADEIRRAENAIRQVYEAQGYPFASVHGEERAEDRLDRRLIFTIDEGEQFQIERLEFEGLFAFSERAARTGFGTQPFGLFDAGGYLQREQLLADFGRLEQRYRQAGYMQAVVRQFSIRSNDRGDRITIGINVVEGEQTRVESVELSGYQTADPQALRQLLAVGTGDPFVPLNVRADEARIAQYYGTLGHPRATVRTRCIRLNGEEVSCEAPRLPSQCQRSRFEDLGDGACWTPQIGDGENGDGETAPAHHIVCERVVRDEECVFSGGVVDERINIFHEIDEGPVVRVGAILLKGNFRTRAGVIYRELPLEPGQLLNVQELIEGQGNMRSLGLFDSVSIETVGLDSHDDDGEELTASLIISVEESRSRYLDFRFGVEGRDLLAEGRRLLLTGETQYSNNNLLGLGQRFRPRVIGAVDSLELMRFGADATREIEAGARSLDYLFGAELIYSHPRFLKGLLGVDRLYLTITPFYLIDLLGVASEQVLREEWGLRLEVRKELFEWVDRFYLTFGVEAKQAATWTPSDLRIDGERIFSPRRATGKLVPELTLDRRNSPLNPTRGFFLRFQPELVSGDALAHGGEELVGDSYWRLSFEASLFLRFWEDFTLGQGVLIGQVTPLFDRQTLVPPDERFYLGGVGSVRGFPTNALGPTGGRQQPTGGEFLINYNAELRYPLVRDWSLFGAAFLDVGLLVDCFDEANQRSTSQCYANAFPDDNPFGQVRASAGLGLRYLLVDQIPLLFDYGMVLNRRPGEGFGAFHFNLGYTF